MNNGTTKVSFSVPSLIAIIAAVVSFGVSALWGFILALVAIFFGLIGATMALAPSVRGGLLSIFSILVAVAAIVVAAIKAVAWLL